MAVRAADRAAGAGRLSFTASVTLLHTRSGRTWADITALKQANPIEVIAGRYGVELRRQGRGWVGRCPFHADGGRPNFYAYDTQSWCCYRCGIGGDVLDFVMRIEQVGFQEAVERLSGPAPMPTRSLLRVPEPRRATQPSERSPDERAVLQATSTLYHQRLCTDPDALAYVSARGIDRSTIQRSRVGFAAGDELASYLKWRGLPIAAALSTGLLSRAGQEHFADRIVVPELQDGSVTWFVGRLVDRPLLPEDTSTGEADNSTSAEDERPKYLTLPGPKPLLGWEQARGSPSVCVVEGVFDLLALRMWGYPVVALVGTHTRPDLLERLRTFRRTYLVLDSDDAGVEATLKLAEELGELAVPVALPEGIKDVAELAVRPDGQPVFAKALMESVGASSTSST